MNWHTINGGLIGGGGVLGPVVPVANTQTDLLQWGLAALTVEMTAHASQPIYRLDNADGRWKPVSGSTPISANEAYWIRTQGNSRYQGRMHLVLDQGESLAFDAGSGGTPCHGELLLAFDPARLVAVAKMGCPV